MFVSNEYEADIQKTNRESFPLNVSALLGWIVQCVGNYTSIWWICVCMCVSFVCWPAVSWVHRPSRRWRAPPWLLYRRLLLQWPLRRPFFPRRKEWKGQILLFRRQVRDHTRQLGVKHHFLMIYSTVLFLTLTQAFSDMIMTHISDESESYTDSHTLTYTHRQRRCYWRGVSLM